MAANRERTVYIGNLDERVSDRVLYDIMIQAGRVVDLHIPRDRETDKPKGYAFAEYETEEIANYAVKLFSGLVTLYNRPLKFAISGQDKPSSNVSATTATTSISSENLRSHPTRGSTADVAHPSPGFPTPGGLSAYSSSYAQVTPRGSRDLNGYGSHSSGGDYDYSRRAFGATLESITRGRPRRYDTSDRVSYPSY